MTLPGEPQAGSIQNWGCRMSEVLPINADPRFRLSTAVGGETSFSVPFPFQDNDDIRVVRFADADDLTGAELQEGLHYSLTGAGEPGGGTVALVTAAVAGQRYLRVGAAAIDRVLSVVRDGKFKSRAIDDDMDRFIIIAQELARETNRALRLAYGAEAVELDPAVPGKFWRWSADGTRIEFVDVLADGEIAASAYMQGVLGSADAAAARTALGIRPTVFNTVGDMVASTSLQVGMVVETLGYHAAGDGGENTYTIVAAATGTHDGGAYINLSGISGQARANLVPGHARSVLQWGARFDDSTDDRAAIQATIDSSALPMTVMLPGRTGRITGTIYLRRSRVKIVGLGVSATFIRYVNAAGGIAFSGDTDTYNSLNTYADCALEEFEVLSSAAGTDPQIVVDVTSFSYSHFSINAQNRRVGGRIYYGQGNAGTSPYFNHFESRGLFGGTDRTQIAFQFHGGAWAGGSSGPNANIIGPITRAASLAVIFDFKVGLQNLVSQVTGESINDAYVLLGGNAAVSSGTSTGSNGQLTLIDTGKAWSTNAYVNGAVRINTGTGAGQTRKIRSNTATTLTLKEPWVVVPDATSTYEVFELRCAGNKFSQIRGEGLSSDNPDFIYAYPDCDHNEFDQVDVSSLGTGKIVNDNSGSFTQKLYAGERVLITHSFVNPGASANVDAWSRSGALGGRPVGGDYVVEWIRVNKQAAASGDTCTVTLDAGGAAVGGGSPSIGVVIANNRDAGGGSPSAATKVPKIGVNNNLFLNLTTGASFSATVDVEVTICLTLLH